MTTATTAIPSTGLEIQLAQRPEGWPTQDTFAVVEAPVPTPGPGQILVRNLVMSVDPAMRGRMNDVKSYMPPFELNKAMEGGAVGEVVASNFRWPQAVGDTVLHSLGWREYAVLDGKRAAKVDPSLAPVGAYLGVLGMPGLTAYAGLLDVAAFKPGETVFVSGAAGAVGSVVGQIAKLKGAGRVVGSAGRPTRSSTSSRSSASTRRSTTRTARSSISCARPRRTASTCTSTTSAASTWKRRSRNCTCTAGSPSAA